MLKTNVTKIKFIKYKIILKTKNLYLPDPDYANYAHIHEANISTYMD